MNHSNAAKIYIDNLTQDFRSPKINFHPGAFMQELEQASQLLVKTPQKKREKSKEFSRDPKD